MLIQKALKKLMNGVKPPTITSETEDIADNNNEEMTDADGNNIVVDPEEEEEALSESEIPEDSIRGLDFQTMYQSFMSGSISEDSDGSKDVVALGTDDGQGVNINFSDSNSPLR